MLWLEGGGGAFRGSVRVIFLSHINVYFTFRYKLVRGFFPKLKRISELVKLCTGRTSLAHTLILMLV